MTADACLLDAPRDSCLPPPGIEYRATPRLEFLLARPDGPNLVHQSFHTGGSRFEAILPGAPVHILLFSLRVEGAAVEGRIAGERKDYVRRNGQHMIIPAGADSAWASGAANNETLCFGYPADWLEEAAGRHGFRPGAAALPPCVAQRDPILAGLAGHARILRDEGTGSAEAFEHIAAMAALRLLGGPVTAARAGMLAPGRLRRVLEHIEAHLDETLRLEELAATAGLSLFHFARAFRQTMGMAPHAYVLERRVARAQQMLRGRDDALADIALACGFADQSHFTTAFRRTTGTTPRRWRAGLG